ncbi:replicative DNA helicase [Candidatus Parcubacteria bacterium]|nr:MAG: replicative DNA helicase [Candidatus Parcubacteria bacterium]
MATKKELKLPPQNLEAEQSVLGCLLIDKNAITKVADILEPRDFYSPAHEKIYQAAIELYEKGIPIDILSVSNRLKEKKMLKDAGGSSYLAELASLVPTSSHVVHYAKIVREKRLRRDLINVSAEITEQAFAQDRDIEEVMDSIEQRILSLSQQSSLQNLTPIKDELAAAYERIERLHHGEDATRGIPTGFPDLDNILSGLQKSNLIVLGARPSLGKTTLALDIARNASLKSEASVGIFSIEMSREEVIDRLISAESQVPLWKIRTGRITEDLEFEMIQNAMDRLSRAKIYIDDTPSPTIMQLRSMARRLQLERGLDLIIIDYLQLVLPRTNSESIVQQVTEISRGLKALARELNVPVLALSQLSRAVDQREQRIPRLSDLRESGSIEQDADVVLFLYRKDKIGIDTTPEEENITYINIAKHRNGPLGSVQVKFDFERVTFRSIEKRYEAAEEEIGVEPEL